MTSLIVVSLIAGSAVTAPAAAALTVEDFEQCLLGLINRDRIANGAGTLEMAYDLNPAVSRLLTEDGRRGRLAPHDVSRAQPDSPAIAGIPGAKTLLGTPIEAFPTAPPFTACL